MMEISDEVYINSMNDISKHFQIMLDNKDKKIADLQLQLDLANEVIKLMYKDLLETGEWQKSMAVYRKEAEKKLQELQNGDF